MIAKLQLPELVIDKPLNNAKLQGPAKKSANSKNIFGVYILFKLSYEKHI